MSHSAWVALGVMGFALLLVGLFLGVAYLLRNYEGEG